MKKIILLLSIVTLVFGCKNENAKRIFMDSNGRMNHVLLVVENSQWSSEIGDKLRNIIMTPVLGMPQEENQFDISQVGLQAFGKMFKASRNVLIIEVGDKNAFETKRNLYAKPQQIVKVTGTSEAEVVETLEKHRKELIAAFKDFDLINIQKGNAKKSYPKETFKTFGKLGIDMTIPTFFRKVDDTGDFLWLRQHLSGGLAKGDSNSNILVYSVPMPENKDDLVATISQMRDSIGKKYIPGSKENMFMVTEKAFTPVVFSTKLNDKITYETHGKWELLNDFMAGPFLNYAIEDVKNNRWIVVEGFTYAPSVEKRDFMFELESILKTIQIQ